MASSTLGGVTTTYVYNALGQRVRKSIGGNSTFFVYDQFGHLLGEYGTAGALIQETVWLNKTPVAVLKPNGSGGVNVSYIHADHLDTPRRISRPSDNVIVWRWESDPFGSGAAAENPAGQGLFSFNLRFPGQYFDAESGLYYNNARDYDAASGRYIQSDPIGIHGGLNTYRYASARPTLAVDPTGLLDFSLLVTTGSYVDAFDNNDLARTTAAIVMRECACKESCGQWVLQQCAANLAIHVTLLRKYPIPEQGPWAMQGEMDHVYDLRAASGDIRRAGEAAEKRMQAERFTSKAACEISSRIAVEVAMDAALNRAKKESWNYWDDPTKSGRHIWDDHRRR